MALLKTALAGGALVAALLAPSAASAASSKGCDGGGFTLRLADGSTVKPDFRGSIAAAKLPAGTRVQAVGKYVTFAIDPASFAVYDYAFTGAPNPLDQTGGRGIVLYASKVPDHRGLTLTDAASIRLDKENLELSRTGIGLSMKLQAKDCANGGLFQMEPERADGTTTRFTHTLGPDVFYFDNPNFRAREGDVVPYKDTTATVTARINIGTDLTSKLVARDSPQVATRVTQGCVNSIPAPRRPGGFQTVDHCGGVSVWDVASGGRMGGVTGEDATEVAPPATTCTTDCQAQNQVRGQAVVLGAPFPVPAANRLNPRFPA
ncbi:hypothetical protein [Solirubrobacter soli]|uniref:hypothetical protein n=1 Tax=Solirubrobacter soli TaxID=363832 RepID=UPI0004116785|nr:hypothetical protein [Solirubrobacter soli]